LRGGGGSLRIFFDRLGGEREDGGKGREQGSVVTGFHGSLSVGQWGLVVVKRAA
jgi:hypothetical protein